MSEFNGVLIDNELAEQIKIAITYDDPTELLYIPFYN